MAAGGIGRLEAGLPEAPPGAEQGIVGRAVARILGPQPDPRALQVTGDLAGVRLEHPLDRRTRARPLVQQHLAGHRFDVRIGQLDRDPEAVAEPHQRRGAGRERRLSGAHEHDAAVELRLHRLGHFREGGRTVLGLVDVLLHLVEHEDGVRQLAVPGVCAVERRGFRPGWSGAARSRRAAVGGRGQSQSGGLDELLGRDVRPQRRKLLRQQLPGRLDVGREAGVGRDERAGDDRADVEVVELAQPVLPRRLDRGAHAGEQPLLAQPEAEARLRILRGQAAGAEQNRQHAVPDVIDAAAEQRPGGRHGRPPGPVRVGVQLAELRLDLVGQAAAHQAAGRRPVGERRVHPQVGEHLQQVRLAAAEEAADPGRVLLRGPEVREVAVENALQGVAELPVADEGLELGPQFLQRRPVGDVYYPRLPVVGEPRRARVAVEHLVELHRAGPPPCSVIISAGKYAGILTVAGSD